MAVAAYDSDLTSTNSGEIAVANTATDAGTWDESSNATWDDAGAPADETNKYINNTNCISAQFTKAGQGTIIYDGGGTTHAVDTNGAILIWWFWDSPPSLSTYANGGVKLLVGASLGDFYAWDCAGSDFEPAPLAGWYCSAIDPAIGSPDDTVGTPGTAPYDNFGVAINASAQARGYPIAVNAIRVGRCTLEVTAGDATAYGTFAGMETFDTSTNQRYGLFQNIFGSYRWQGLMSLGTATTAVDFRDETGVSIAVANTPNVTSSFNKIEVNHVDSYVLWTGVTITNPGVNNTVAATASRGDFDNVSSGELIWTNCSFTDMGTFTFDASTNTNGLIGCSFKKCNLITGGGATFDNCTFEKTNDSTKAVIVASPAEAALIEDCTFVSSGTGHALEIGGTAANMTLSGCTFTGYDVASPGTNANKAIYVNIATGTMTITASGCTGLVQNTVYSAGATVTVNADVTVTFTGLKDNSEVRIYKVSDDSVVDGIEDATTGTTDNRTFAWSAPAATEVYYRIHCFQPGDEIYETIYVPSYTVPTNDTSVPIAQRLDRNAEN